MGKENTIIDPFTGKEIDNTGKTDLTVAPTRNAIINPFTGEKIKDNQVQEGLDAGVETGITSSFDDFGTLVNQKPGEELSEAYERRAQAQPAFDQMLNGMGKAVVTFGGALAENTLGIPFGVASAIAGKGYQNNIIGQTVDHLNEMAQEAMPNYQTQEERDNITLNTNFFFDKALNGAAYSAAGMISMMMPGGIAKLPSMAARGLSKLAVKQTARNVSKSLVTRMGNIGKASEFAVKGFSGALAESSVEARETQKELRSNLIEDLINRKQEAALASGNFRLNDNGRPDVELTQDELDEIERLSLTGGSANFRMNMLMVGGTQMLTFGNLMRGASKEGYKNLAKKIIQQDGKYVKEVLSNKQNLARGAKTLFTDAAGEAAQEGGQFASNIATNDFYLKSFQDPEKASIYESASKAIEETISSKDGLESMLIGAIVGGGMTAMTKAGESYQQRQLKKKGKLSDEDKAIQKILDIKNSKSFNDIQKAVADNNRILQYNDDLQAAIMENDEAGIQKASFNLLKSDLYSHLNQGTEQVYLEKLAELQELDEQAFKEYFNMQDVQGPIDVKQFSQDMIRKTEEAIQIYKNIDFLYDSNPQGIQKLAANLNQDELKTQEYLKSNLYSALTDHDYMINREDALGKELQEKTNGLVTYLSNKENGGYIQATTDQVQNLLDKEQSKKFKENLKKDWRKIKGLKELLKSYPTKFKNVDEFVDRIIADNEKFAQKQLGFTNAIEAIKESSINPILQKELQNKINELTKLSLQRELNDELIHNLEGQFSGKSNPEFIDKIKANIDKLNKDIKAAVIKQAEEEPAEKDNATAKAAATGDPKVTDKVNDIKDTKTNDTNNTSSDFNDKKLENVIPYMQNRYKENNGGLALWKKEKESILPILRDAKGFDLDVVSKDGLPFLLDALSELEANTETLEKLASFYKKNDAGKKKPRKPAANIKQPYPVDVDSEPSLDTHSDPTDDSVKGSLNLQDDEVVLASPTLKNREGTNYPDIYDKNIGKLNNPLVGLKGTKVLIDYPNNKYNNTKGNNPQLFAYILDEDGNRIDIGLITKGYKKEKSKLGEEIFDQIKPSQIGESAIDLNLTVERKNYSKFNSNDGVMINPTEIDKLPKLAIALEDAGTVVLFNRDIKVNADVKASKLKVGHTYMYVETPQKNSKGEPIYYAAELKTSRVFEMDLGFGDEIVDLLLSDTKEKKGKKPKNFSKVNDQIFLNYDVNGDTITIYDFADKEDAEIVLRVDKNNPEDVEKLKSFIGSAVVKVDIKKINNPAYNKKIANEGRIKIDLDPVVPIYDTHFVVKQNKVEEPGIPVDDFDWGDTTDTTEPTVKTDAVSDTVSDAVKQKPLAPKVDTNENLGSFLPKLKTKNTRPTSNTTREENESELNYVKRMIPNTPVSTQVDLARIAKQGSQAAGLFLNGVIYLEKNFQKGTAFHEAFHAVYNSYLTEEERQQIYVAAQAEYGGSSYSEKAKLKKLYPTLSTSQLEDIWLEEQLAEEFERYMIGIENQSLSKRITAFFKRLLNAIRGITNNKSIMDEMFRNIHKGKYGKRPINYRFNNVPMLSQRLQGFNSYESLEAVELVHQTFNFLLNQKIQRKLDADGIELSEVEGIALFNQGNKLYHEVYAILENEFNATPEGPQKEFLRNLTFNFYGDTKDTMGDLVKNHKLYYKVYNYIDITDRPLNIDEELSTEELLEELDEIPDFLMPIIEKNSKDKLSKKVKKVLFNLQTDKPNILGYPKLTNFDSLDNTLQEKLSGMMHASEMFDRLEEQSNFHFELKSLIKQLEEDPILQAQFFSHYAMGQDKVLQVVNEETTTSEFGISTTTLENKLIDTSSTQLRKEILTNWESALVNSELFDVDGKINTNVAQKYFNMYTKEVNIIKGKSILQESDLVPLSNVLTKLYNIPLTAKELFSKFNSYETKLQFDKFLDNKSQMKGALEAFANNKNLFISATVTENDSLKAITDAIRDSRKEYFQSSILNGEGKQEYTYRVPAYIHKATSLFNSKNAVKYVDKIYANDPSFDNSLLLDQIRLGREINIRKVDSIQLQDETTGTRFKNYNALKYQTVNLQLYINQEEGKKKKSNKAFYQMAITSDAPVNYFIENDKFTISESLDNLYNIYLFEKERIETSTEVENYNAKEFILLPFFNNETDLDKKTPTQITEIIEKNMNKYYNTYRQGLIDSGFAYETNGELQSDYISDTYTKSAKYDSLEDIAKEYYFASFFMMAESTTVFAGDPSFAKPDKITGSKITDMNKRLREITSPAQMLNTSVMGITKDKNNKAQSNTKYTTLLVADEKRTIVGNELYKAVANKFPRVKNPTTQKEFNNNIRLDVLAKSIDNTDGTSIITMERFKNIKQGQGLWSAKMEKAYNRIKEGKQTFADEELFMNPIKGFHFELLVDESGKVVPFQKKDSEIVLLPSMTENNPNLQKIWDRLYDVENPADMISFESAVKKGVHNKNTLDNLYTADPIELNYTFYGIQQPTPEKHIDSKITFGTQFRKIIIGNLSGEYSLNGTPKTDREIKNLYEKFISANLEEDSVAVIKEMGYDYETGEIDYKKLEKLLLRELDNGDYGPEFKEYLELNDKGDGFKLELWNPIHSHRIEALLQSYVKNRVSIQKIKGATLVNGTNIMVEGNTAIKPSIQGRDDLQVVMGEDAEGNPYIEHFEAVLPAWSKDIMLEYMNEDGSIKDSMPQELRELVGYRIPTESKYSMAKIYVKAFTPQAQGSTIFLPTEIIALTGLDFDIDKMYFMIPEHKVIYNPSRLKQAYNFIEEDGYTKNDILNEYYNGEDVGVSIDETYLKSLSFAELKRNFIEDFILTESNTGIKQAFEAEYPTTTNKINGIQYIAPNYDDISKNSKKQRNNGIIEISKSILSAPQTLDEQTNPGSFDNLIAHRNDIAKPKELTSFAAPDVQQELFERTRDASALIGVFANNVASNNMLQYENLELLNSFDFLGNKITELDEKGNLEITRSLSTLVAAAVDAVKDPIFKDLNITKFTGNVLATMIRLGVNEKDALKVLNNRKVIKLAEEVSKLKFQKPSEIFSLIDTLKNDVTVDTVFKTRKDLNASINNSKTNNNLDDIALSTFRKFYVISQDVAKLTRATKIDANPPGTTMADNEVTMRTVKEVKDGLNSFVDTGVIFSDASNYPLINKFYETTYLEPNKKVFTKLFPWYKPNFNKSKNDILSHLTEQALSSKQINNINNSLLTYFASQDGNLLLSVEDRARLKKDFWKQLNKFRIKNPNKYLILDMLQYDEKNKVIRFKNTTKLSSYKTTELKNSWYDLFVDLHGTENENIAEDLFKYNFMINGFNYNSKSFTHLAPQMMFTDLLKVDKVNELIDKGQVEAFVASYLMNNFKTLSLPQLKKSDPGIERGNYKIDKRKKLYYFIGNDSLPNVQTEYGEEQVSYFPKYIKSEDNSRLFMRRGPEEVHGRNPKVEYFAVRGLGSKFATEYVYNDSNFQTSEAENYIYKSKDMTIASAKMETIYQDILQENILQTDTGVNVTDNNSDVFGPAETLEGLNTEQQEELNEILVDKEVTDRIVKSYPDIVEFNGFTFDTRELRGIKYALFEEEIFSKEDNLTIKDQRNFKNDYLKEYGMTDKAYEYAKKNEQNIINVLEATINEDNTYMDSITNAVDKILKENEILTDTNQGDLFKGFKDVNPDIQIIINSVIDELKTAEYLTDKQKEYFSKILKDNPTREGYTEFKEQFCK